MKVLPILFNTDMVRALLEKRKSVTRRVIKPQPPIDFRYPQADDSESRWWWTDKDGDDDMMRWWPSYENGLIPPYEPGDILYVRETWCKTLDDRCVGNVTGVCPYESCENSKGDCFAEEYVYKASDSLPSGEKWRPSIHMPMEAARIFLRVKAVRAERLQDSFIAPISPIFELWAEGMDIGDDCRHCIATYGNPCCVDTVDEDGSNLYGGDYGILDEIRGEFSNLWDSTVKPKELDKYGWAANPWVWVIEFERVDKPEGWPI